MKIAVDAMGGDRAPAEIVCGAVEACRELNVDIVLVGDEKAVQEFLPSENRPAGISIRHAAETVEMDEQPLLALRRKKDASVAVAAELLRDGQADAVVTAGNTGAAMAATTMRAGRLPGVDRPAIAVVLPSVSGKVVVLDAGANVSCRPHNLLQFGLMGSIYAQCELGLASPRVGLLSIGEEEGKGNELTKAAHGMLTESGLNFVGNVEGQDIGVGSVDVVVCDGFVGNIVLKVAEGFAQCFASMLRTELGVGWRTKAGFWLLQNGFRSFKRRMDYSEYGGAALLGISGVCIIGHGSSNARAISRAIAVAKQCVEAGIVGRLRSALASEARSQQGVEAASSTKAADG